jgi:hypothetical protein
LINISREKEAKHRTKKRYFKTNLCSVLSKEIFFGLKRKGRRRGSNLITGVFFFNGTQKFEIGPEN